MEKGKRGLSPFTVLAIVVLIATLCMYANFYVMNAFTVFTNEDEIEAAIQTEFPFFADYL